MLLSNLQQLLSQRDSKDFTPLLLAVRAHDTVASLYLMRQASSYNVHEVHGASVRQVFDNKKKCCKLCIASNNQ